MTWTLGEDALLTLAASCALLGLLAGLVLGFGWASLAARRTRFSRRDRRGTRS